jgi:hypothetical protein
VYDEVTSWLMAGESVGVDVSHFLLSSVYLLQETTKKLRSLALEQYTAKKLELPGCNTCRSYRINLFSSASMRLSQQLVAIFMSASVVMRPQERLETGYGVTIPY